MLKHIVLWKLSPENKIANAEKAKNLLENLVGKVPEIAEIDVGIDIKIEEQAYDLALISTFKNSEDLQKYKINPDHMEVGKFIKEIAVSRVVVDFTF